MTDKEHKRIIQRLFYIMKYKSLFFTKLVIVIVIFTMHAFESWAYSGSVTLAGGQTIYYQCDAGQSVYITSPGNPGDFAWYGFTKPSGDIIIPDSITHDGIKYPVVGINAYSFSRCYDITSIILPDGISFIGEWAFFDCRALTTINLGNGNATIDNFAFQYCTELSSVVMGNNILCDMTAFDGCFKLNSVTIGEKTLNVYSYDTTLGKTYVTVSHISPEDFYVQIWTNDIKEHYHVVWSDGNSYEVYNGLNITSDLNLIAYFVPDRHSLTVIINDSTFGSLTLPDGDTANYGDTLLVVAHPATHYHTVRWTGASLVSANKDTAWIIMNGNRTLRCYFAKDTHYVSLQVNDIAFGTVSGAGYREYGRSITVMATPYSGYQFTHWSNGVTYNPYTFAVQKDTALTAIFVADGEPWQDTVVLYDTVHVILHDTTNVTDTVTLTEYVPIHDTTYIDVPYVVHDTTVVTDTVTLTEYVPMHDTTYIDVFVHDTTVVTDTVTLIQFDTIINMMYDTIDNIIYDTLLLTDTIWLHDTIVIHDTIVVGIDGIETINAKIYQRNGQVVVECANGNKVTLYDVNGRVLAIKQDYDMPLRFDVPATGTYMIKIGNAPARRVVVIR